MDRLPYIDADLLKYLEILYPDTFPDPKIDERELWQRCGAVLLVRHLRSIFEEQQNLTKGGL